ncbi:MAG TPA: YihY/virulence factor BrkB family protein [Candidatus Binatia bacterium]|nr:YihY/virulence factor BrkB family protein [Candidatus Binatia bacterium]
MTPGRSIQARLGHSALSPWIRALLDFNTHRGIVHAASLSYTSLLALVPLIALVLAISKGVLRSQDPQLLLKAVDHFLNYAVPQLQYLPADEAASARQDALARIDDAISRIDAGALGAFGAFTLVSVGISLLSAIEHSLNDIWGVARGRPLSRRVAYYWAGVTLGPLFLFLAIGITGSNAVASVLGYFPSAPIVRAFWAVLPFVILSAGLTLLYWTMPNTYVPTTAAMRGGITAGTLLQLNNLASALYFSQVLQYSKVYGSLGAIPVMMVGLYFSWVVVLYGAEVAHAAASPDVESLPFPEGDVGRSRVVLEVARLGAAAFLSGRGGISRADLAEQSSFSDAWVGTALDLLCEEGFFAAAADDGNGPPRYLPARPPGEIAVLDILTAVRRPTKDAAGLPEPTAAVAKFLARLTDAERAGVGQLSLETLARGESE